MYLLFDIGGTKMRLAVSPNGGDLSKPEIISTPQDFDEGIKQFREAVERLSEGKKIEAAAGGIRRLDPSKSELVPDFRLPNWSGKPLKKRLSEVVSAPVYLENDTAMVGLGEAVVGAGKDFNVVVYITISTGVGGVRIVDKKIDRNKYGFEPGYQIIDFDWTALPDCQVLKEEGRMGQFEAYVSGTSVEKRFGKKPREITDEGVWDEIARLVALGLNNTIVFWSPDVIVLGGGMMGSPGISIEKVKSHLKNILKIFLELPEIKKAELGDLGGLHGALAYLKQLGVK